LLAVSLVLFTLLALAPADPFGQLAQNLDIPPEVGTFVLSVAVIAGLSWMRVARLVRASFLSVKEQEFI
jgi:ABC-type dipeptide/oligopeptide/nickel transport system permease subunit